MLAAADRLGLYDSESTITIETIPKTIIITGLLKIVYCKYLTVINAIMAEIAIAPAM